VEMERAVTQQPGRDAPLGRLRLRHPAELSELRPIRREVERWAVEHRVTDDELIDLQLAIGEAVSNGIEHGYRERRPGPVEVDLELRPQGSQRLLAVRVFDHGRWRPAPARPGYRGRGLAMIRSLSADLCVTSDSRGTEVTFTVALAAQ
jgi:anti-sigma regulatory factor (Ser/Thr protein kinase)